MQDEFGVALAAVADLSHTFSARLSVATRGSFGLDGGGAFEGGATVFGAVAARY
jgi:hypothetical protein